MNGSGQNDTPLATQRQRAVSRAATYFLIGALATLAAIASAFVPHPLPAGWSLILLEAVALFGFFRFGWWFSHLRALEQGLDGTRPLALAAERLF